MALKVACVFAALGVLKATLAGPLTVVHEMLSVPEVGRPSSGRLN